MYPVGGAGVLELVLLVWLIFLSYFFWKDRKFLGQLFPKSKLDSNGGIGLMLKGKFEELIKGLDEESQKSKNLSRSLVDIRKAGLSHIQNLAMLRYNPYNDTGGDQSFSVAILDGKLNGLMLTSLHSRAGTRIYIKNIRLGKSDLELSKEEEQVLENAIINQ